MRLLDLLLRRRPSCKRRVDEAMQRLQTALLNLDLAVHGVPLRPIAVVFPADRPKKIKLK